MFLKFNYKENIEFFIKRFKNINKKNKTLFKLKLKNKGYFKKSNIKTLKKKNRLKKIQFKIRRDNFLKKLY